MLDRADRAYPNIIDECAAAMAIVRGVGGGPSRANKIGCIEVYQAWKHWTCLFPQHGSGRKHQRDVSLVRWQSSVAEQHPERLVRGLIHSDGCRDRNRVNGKDYSRYLFVNHSEDILRIFAGALDHLGIRWRRNSTTTIAVARRSEVAKLDAFVGPKS